LALLLRRQDSTRNFVVAHRVTCHSTVPDALPDAGTGATDPRNPGVGTPGETWKSVEGKKIPGVVLESSWSRPGVVLEVPKSGVRPLEITVQQNF